MDFTMNSSINLDENKLFLGNFEDLITIDTRRYLKLAPVDHNVIIYNYISQQNGCKHPDFIMNGQYIGAENIKIFEKENIIKLPKLQPRNPYEPKEEGEVTNTFEKNTYSENECSISPERSNNYDEMRFATQRYYNFTSNLSLKCNNCDQVGHLSKNCPMEEIITCIKCNQKGHKEINCPNIKCFKCNKIGHKSYECKLISGDQIEKCESCKNIGHLSKDCLIAPAQITLNENVICSICGHSGHYLCPNKQCIIDDYYSEEVSVSDSESIEDDYDSEDGFYDIVKKTLKKKGKQLKQNTSLKRKRKRIFENIRLRDIRKTKFCPKCAEMHSIKECGLKLKENRHDFYRQINSKKLFKKDLKILPRIIPKLNIAISPKKNIYSEINNLSSDESFSKLVAKKRRSVKRSYSSTPIKTTPEKKRIKIYSKIMKQLNFVDNNNANNYSNVPPLGDRRRNTEYSFENMNKNIIFNQFFIKDKDKK
jgi:hypothetical protein